MKKLACLLFITLCASLLISCASLTSNAPTAVPTPAPATSAQMIQPGDKVGDFLITTLEPEKVTHLWDLNWTEGSNVNQSLADVDWGTKPNVSVGVYADPAEGKSLDETWSSFSYKLFIEDRPVDLAAFGTIEINHRVVGKMRVWNVAIVADKPGKLTVHDVVQFPGEPLEESWAILTFLPPATPGKDYQQPKTSEKTKLNYLLYLPEAYEKGTQQKWPLILYLHGIEQKGSNLSWVLRAPLPKKLKTEGDFPFIVVSPQGDGEYDFWSEEAMARSVMVLLDEIQADYSVDPKRIYLTGNNVGGNATWELGLRNPKRFAALVPVLGYYDWNDPSAVPTNICDLKDVPVWAFLGRSDPMIPIEWQQVLVDALKACGGNVKLTVMPNYDNDSEMPAYTEPGLYEWLAAQSLK